MSYMGEMTIKEINERYGTNFRGGEGQILVSRPYIEEGKEVVLWTVYYLAGCGRYFPKLSRTREVGEKFILEPMDTRLF